MIALMRMYHILSSNLAVEGEDFTVTGALEVPPGSNSSCVAVDIINDSILEGDHDFTLSIIETSPSVTINPESDSVIITISDSEDRKC